MMPTDSNNSEKFDFSGEESPNTNSPHDTAAAPDVSIIIVTYNSSEDILQCVDGAKKHTRNCSTEFIILDNCSKDSTVKIIQEEISDALLIQPDKNLGFAKGVNEAAKRAKGKYVLLLNPDTTIFSNAIGNIYKFAEENPQYGLYGAKTLKPDRTLQPLSCLGLPSLWSIFTFATGLSAIFKNTVFFDPESLGKWKRDTVKEVGSIVGCFLLCRLKHWKTLKGFDETFYMYGEDVDLAFRSRQLGYPSVINPSSELIHEFGKSSQTPIHKLIMLYKGKATYINKHWSGIQKKAAKTLLKTGIAIRASIVSITNAKDTRYQTLWDRRKEWQNGYPSTTTNGSLTQ